MRRRASRMPLLTPARFHVTAVLLLVLGLVVPLLPGARASAAPARPPHAQGAGGEVDAFPAPVRVAVVGTFQVALGCPAEYDPSCGLSALAETGGGTWAGTLAVPAGEYAFRVVATSDRDRSLGRGGDPDGGDLSLSVPADAAGVYFAYDAGTGEITAEPVGQRAALVTDLGQSVALAPAAGGGYEASFDAPAGAHGFQVLFDDQPVAQDVISLDAGSRVSVAVDANGAVVGLGTVEGTSIAISKVDAAGGALPGACYAVLDGGEPAGRACDGDDGVADGQTALRVPDGLAASGYELVESSTPDGQEPAEAQRLDLGPGGFAVEAVVAGGEGVAPSDPSDATDPSGSTDEGATDGGIEPPNDGGQGQEQDAAVAGFGRVVVRSVDGQGEPLAGSCFLVVELGDERCDDDGDGTTVFDAVEPGGYTLAQTAAPDGFAVKPEGPIEVDEDGLRLRVTHDADEEGGAEAGDAGDGIAPAQPVEPAAGEAEPGDETGSLVIAVRDRADGAVVGTCFAVSPREGEAGGEASARCDGDDGAEDGEVGVDGLVAGRYRVDATLVPPGFRAPEPEGVDVLAATAADLTVVLRGEAEEQGQEPEPDAGDAGEEAASPEPTVEPARGPGRLVILVEDEEGEPVGETCFAVEGEGATLPEICDQGNDGRLNIPELPSGEYRVRQLRTGEGLAVAVEEERVEIRPGEDTELPVVNRSEATEVEPTEAAAEATAEATEAPPVVPAVDAGDGDVSGSVRIVAVDADGEPAPLGCYVLVGDEQIEVCDGDRDDAEPAQGEILLEDVAPGEYRVIESRVPPGVEPATATSSATVAEGETVEVSFGGAGSAGGPAIDEQPAVDSDSTGELLVAVDDEEGRPVEGACLTLAGPGAVGPICDGERGDEEGESGRLQLIGLEPGDYQVSVGPPDGFGAADAQQATVGGSETARVRFVLAAVVETGSVRVALSASGQSVPGACVELVGRETIGPVCDRSGQGWRAPSAQDGGDPTQDADPAPGVIVLEGVPAGEYELRLSNLPADLGTPAARPVSVAAGEAVEVAIEVEAALGTLVILVADEAGDPFGGTCFALDGPEDFAEICDQGDDGRLNIPEIPAGEYVVRQTTAESGREPAAEERVEVPAGGSEELRVENRAAAEPTEPATPEPSPTAEPEATAEPSPTVEPEATAEPPTAPPVEPGGDEVGSVLLVGRGADGVGIGGACYRLTGDDGTVVAELCDDGPNDANPDAGDVTVAGIPAGSYDVEQTRAADGLAVAEPQAVVVEAGAEAVAEFVGEVVAAETASVVLVAQDETGAAVDGQCFLLAGDGQEFGPFCDNGAEDVDPTAGSLEIAGLALGAYEAVEVAADEAGEPEVDANGQVVSEQRAVERRSFNLGRGERPLVRLIVRRQRQEAGDLLVAKRDEQGRPLTGSCFALIDGDGDAIAEVCDGDGNDGDGNEGQLRFDEIPNGDYTLAERRAPEGYLGAEDQAVTISGGRLRRATVANEPLPEAASLTVVTVDEAGGELTGACYALLRGAGQIGPICDAGDDGGDDGRTVFADLEAGSLILRETRAPSADYAAGRDRALLLAAGEAREERVVNVALPGAVLIEKVDGSGQPLDGACFALVWGDGVVAYELCDGDASDALADEGTLLLRGVSAGEYLVRETRAPAGFATAAEQAATVAANRRSDLRFENVPLPPPPQRGDLVVFKTDAEDRLLAGSCFALLRDGVVEAGPRCDANDGADDGTIRFADVGVGDYALREVRRPSADYLPIADVAVSVALNETTEIGVENRLRPGRVVVRKTDVDGDPLGGACFNLEGDGQDPICTDAAGLLAFEDLAPGSYRLVETQPPAGYLAAAAIEAVEVRPGATTTLDVVNELAPPPPDTGSIQILKFTCPAGEGGEGTDIVDSSDGGPSRLARTAGCQPSDAVFDLVADSGEGGPGEIATGVDGRYQTTLLAGDYVLTEVVPDLPSEATEEVAVFVNQMTTVVVLNYVAPPAPAPAAIDVVKYTCEAGFEGTVFADFVAGCAADENLTNSVLFRLSGEISARRLTGDGGSQGVTGFGQLPPGEYRLREDPPTAAQSVVAFCGLDANAPTLRSSTTAIDLMLGAGERTTCFWFNVPDDLTETTGAVVVHKYGCALTGAQSAPSGFDWYDECAPQGAGIRFSLALIEGETRTPLGTAATDGDGIVRFNRLEAGVYELQEVGASWCRAESDSVDARGHVVVTAGERSSVWIFNCLGTKSPPNTGAGPLAGGAASNLAAALGLIWPLAGVVLDIVWRRVVP